MQCDNLKIVQSRSNRLHGKIGLMKELRASLTSGDGIGDRTTTQVGVEASVPDERII